MMLLQEKEDEENNCGDMNILREERAVFAQSRDGLRTTIMGVSDRNLFAF